MTTRYLELFNVPRFLFFVQIPHCESWFLTLSQSSELLKVFLHSISVPVPKLNDVFQGRDNRKKRLQALYASICKVGLPKAQQPNRSLEGQVFSLEYAQQLKAAYDNDLFSHFGNHSHPAHIGWTEFESYAEEKETELWSVFHDELDLDGNGKLDERELDLALRKTGSRL